MGKGSDTSSARPQRRGRAGALWRRLALLLFVLSAVAGCSVLNPPERRPLPTPLPTLEPFVLPSADEFGQTQRVAALGTGNEPDLDPDVVALMSAVSEQQLMAYVQTLGDFYTRNSFSETGSDATGIGAARRWLFSEFERVGNGRLRVEFEDFDMNFAGVTLRQRNVVATLPGTGNHRGAIVIGGHYDSRVGESTDGRSYSPSANDNGSGIAMLLELARLVSSRQWNQTIIFVAFAAEEQETQGSRAFVSQSFITQRQIDLAISNDTIGGRDGIPQSIRLFAPEMETSTHGHTARYIDYLARLYIPEFPIELNNAPDREGRYGDQREFQFAAIPAVRFTESVEDETLLNNASDTWEKLDYSYLAQVTRLNLVTIADWAGGPAPAAPPAVSATGEPGSFLLSWTADSQAAAYAVAFRPVSSLRMPLLRTVAATDAGNVVLGGLDPTQTYAVSIAPIGFTGKLGGFSPEVLVFPTQSETASSGNNSQTP